MARSKALIAGLFALALFVAQVAQAARMECLLILYITVDSCTSVQTCTYYDDYGGFAGRVREWRDC